MEVEEEEVLPLDGNYMKDDDQQSLRFYFNFLQRGEIYVSHSFRLYLIGNDCFYYTDVVQGTH